jgi:hypothetical protein
MTNANLCQADPVEAISKYYRKFVIPTKEGSHHTNLVERLDIFVVKKI